MGDATNNLILFTWLMACVFIKKINKLFIQIIYKRINKIKILFYIKCT